MRAESKCNDITMKPRGAAAPAVCPNPASPPAAHDYTAKPVSTPDRPVGIITGALSGIGAATAREFARLGASLVLADIATESGERLTTEVAELGGTATVAETDVTDYPAVERLVERT